MGVLAPVVLGHFVGMAAGAGLGRHHRHHRHPVFRRAPFVVGKFVLLVVVDVDPGVGRVALVAIQAGDIGRPWRLMDQSVKIPGLTCLWHSMQATACLDMLRSMRNSLILGRFTPALAWVLAGFRAVPGDHRPRQ